MEENDVREQFKKEVETELRSLIETYFDGDYSEFEEFEKALADDKADIDQIIYGNVIETLMKNKIREWYVCTVPSENEEERQRLREFKQWCIKTNKSIDINWLGEGGSDDDFEILIFPKSKAEHNRVNKKLDSVGIDYAVFAFDTSIGESWILPKRRYNELHYRN